jgi:DNA repair protein RecO (recombination protein O)
MSIRYQTDGVVLKRVDFGEADRIISFFTPDRGKVAVMAKGVRKPKSKLAGGIELFSVCHIGAIKGKRDIDTLVSSRLNKHFEAIVKDYDRLQIAYSMLQLIDHFTEDEAGEEYYDLLVDGLELLDGEQVSDSVAACWFYMQAMKLHGGTPNVIHDVHGNKLEESATYTFSTEDGGFFLSDVGIYGSEDIKAWRVFISADKDQLKRVSSLEAPADKSTDVLLRFAEFQV